MRTRGRNFRRQPADIQGSLFKMRAETKQEVVKVDSFRIFWLCCAFNFYLSIQMTGPDSNQRQLAHRCAFFMSKLTRHFQHLSVWSLSSSVFHLHRNFPCAVAFNPEETRSASGRGEIQRQRFQKKNQGGWIYNWEGKRERMSLHSLVLRGAFWQEWHTIP